MMLRILFIGDIFASAGRNLVYQFLPELREELELDLVIANVENAAGGFGVTPEIADQLFASGVDVMTSGNHIWDRREIYEYLDHQPRLLRPANYPPGLPGSGVLVSQTLSGIPYAVINLQGRVFMPSIDCPFRKANEILDQLDARIRVRIVDFHAEVTSEKMAMGWHLDGRVTAVLGTHTHVPTADHRILPQGTAYVTDVGMTGPYDSVIGVRKDRSLQRFLTGLPAKYEAAKGKPELHAAYLEVDPSCGRALKITHVVREM